MVSEARGRRPVPAQLAAVATLLTAMAAPAGAQPQQQPSAAGIYTCVDAQGRRLTSDRPIADCSAREQQQLNRDGSVKRVLPPTLSLEERAEKEAAERRVAQARAEQAERVRRDRNLMLRYPDEDTHQKAREAALAPVRQAIQASERRLAELAAERKPLMTEAEFYNKGRSLPPKLRQQIDANDAGVEAQKVATANQQAELARVNRLYDLELDRLRRLWAGAAPGSLGPLQPPAAAPAPEASSAVRAGSAGRAGARPAASLSPASPSAAR